MDTSFKILVTAGALVLAYGFLLGIPMAQARMKAAAAPRQLVNNHLEALIGGAVLIALAVAIDFSTLSTGLETTAAWLLSIAVGLAVVGGTLNWLQRVDDAFASRSPGFYLQSLSGPLNLAGIGLVVMGVLKAL